MDQVEEIKTRIDIVALISEYLPLKKAGRNFNTLCPFHSEKTPSFIISPELQIFKCFGCGESGDAIKFLQLYEKMDFWEALEFLARRTGIKLIRRRLSGDEKFKKRLYEINHLATEFYHFLLVEHEIGKKALDYVLKRGFKKETIEKFQLGFSPAKPDAVTDFLTKKGYSTPEISQAGLIFPARNGGYWDRFRQRLIFPLHDHRGNIIGFSGRVIPGISPSKIAKYINTPETKLYHKGRSLYGFWLNRDQIREKKEIVVVEGETDVISSYQAGVKNVVAIKGTAFTNDQAKLIRRFAETAILALDADAAGGEAIKRSAQVAETVGLDVKIGVLPKGFHDLDELAQRAPKTLKKLIAKPVAVWDFVVDLAFVKKDLRDPGAKKRVLIEALPFLVEIENEVVKNHYFQKLARRLGVDLEAILIEVEKIKSKSDSTRGQEYLDITKTSQTRRYLLERYLLTLIFSQQKWKWFKDKSWFDLIANPLFKRIISLAHKSLGKKRKLAVRDFFTGLPGELRAGFERIYLDSQQERKEEEDIDKVILSLKEENLRQRLSELALEISCSEKEGKPKRLNKLEREFVNIGRQIVNLQKNAKVVI